MTETISVLIEGGNASAGPPLGPELGPTPVNVQDVVNEINEKTENYEGIEVPVEVKVDTDTGDFEVEVGSPPVSALIKQELNLEKLSGEPNKYKVGDLKIDQLIKVARSIKNNSLARTDKKLVKEVAGAAQSMGVLIEGKEPKQIIEEINKGKYEAKIKGEEELEEVSEEEIEKRKQELEEKMEEIKAEEEEEEEEELEEEEEETEEEEEEEDEGEHHAPGETVDL